MSPYTKNSLQGKKILVTGASSGIGKATSIMLSECGAELVLCGRNIDRLNQVKELLNESNIHNLEEIEFISTEQIAYDLERVVKKYGAFDGVFHSAGTSLLKPIKLITDKDINYIFGPSVFASLAIGKVFSKKMNLNEFGSIVFMSSVAAFAGQQGMTVYSSSKASIDGLVRSLANELANRRIRVNSIAAGAIVTEMHDKMLGFSNSDVANDYLNKHLLGFGKPNDVAALVIYMMADVSRWMTGATVVLDGGYISK
jgi:NAD(P)-dependent dehydrogenase (short-subunit alcohol dehydrogenase family)